MADCDHWNHVHLADKGFHGFTKGPVKVVINGELIAWQEFGKRVREILENRKPDTPED